MLSRIIDKDVVKLTQKEFDEVPMMVAYELPNANMYETIFQFRFMDMYGRWNLVNVVHVKNKDEAENGLNFLTSRIEIEE